MKEITRTEPIPNLCLMPPATSSNIWPLTFHWLSTHPFHFHSLPAVYQQQVQPQRANPCGDSCAFLCLGSPRIVENSDSFTCSCPDGWRRDKSNRNSCVQINPGVTDGEWKRLVSVANCNSMSNVSYLQCGSHENRGQEHTPRLSSLNCEKKNVFAGNFRDICVCCSN